MSEEIVSRACAAYIKLRDQKKEITSRHKEELAPLNATMQKLENAMHRKLLEAGARNIATDNGTVYLSTTLKATIKDWGAFRDFMLSNDLIDMMEHRVSKDAVREYREANGALPPGVHITEDINTRFKR